MPLGTLGLVSGRFQRNFFRTPVGDCFGYDILKSLDNRAILVHVPAVQYTLICRIARKLLV